MEGPRPDGAGRWWLAAVPAVAFVLAVTVLDVGRDLALVLTNAGQLTAVLWAGARARAAARTSDPRIRRAWRTFAWAAGCWGAAQAVFGAHEVLLGTEPPELVQLGYLTAVPLCVAALLCFLETPATAAARVVGFVEAALLTAGVLLVAWVLLLQGLFQDAEGGIVARAVAVSFPAVEVLITAVLLFVGARSRPGTRRPLALLGLGATCFLAADLVLAAGTLAGTYRTGRWTDVGWMVAWLLIGTAAGGASPEAASRLLGAGGVALASRLLVLVPVVLAAAVGLAAPALGREDAVTGSLLAVLVLGLLVHAVVAAVERHRLTAYLEDEVTRRTEQLARSEAFVRTVLAHSSEVVVVVGPDGRVTHLTESLWGALGWDGSHFLGRHLTELIVPADVGLLERALGRAEAAPGRPTSCTVRTSHADGSVRTMDVTLVSLLDDPALRSTVVNARDVTDRVALERDLAHLAFHDDLTGLPNRTLFRQRLDAGLARGQDVAVLFVDLDGFKAVNDALGHAAGDELLATFARRLQEVVGERHTLARLGGDEFGILAVGTAEEASALAERLLAALLAPLVVQGRELPIRASIGVATTATGRTSADLLRDADVAMYEAKGKGRSRVEVFTPAMHADAMAELELGADLAQAAGRGELRLHYQPLVELRSGRVVGAEALLRWEHPTFGAVPPVQFIPLAERSGAIVDIGRWVLAEAAGQALHWRRRFGDDAPTVSVNVSGRQLLEVGFVAEVVQTVRAAGARPEWLVLELTESVLVDGVGDAVDRLAALRAAGFGIAVDDFGTGYSALSYLHRLPVDELKIDRTFVQGLERGDDDAGLVRMILELADALSLATVAEGIETEAQRALLAELGCERGQGYLFARPGPPEVVEALLGAYRHEADIGTLRDPCAPRAHDSSRSG